MKGILEFNLPEERQEFEDAQNGTRYAAAFAELYKRFRDQWKYQDKHTFVSEEITAAFTEICEEHGITL